MVLKQFQAVLREATWSQATWPQAIVVLLPEESDILMIIRHSAIACAL